jgi:hypothetical protein
MTVRVGQRDLQRASLGSGRRPVIPLPARPPWVGCREPATCPGPLAPAKLQVKVWLRSAAGLRLVRIFLIRVSQEKPERAPWAVCTELARK